MFATSCLTRAFQQDKFDVQKAVFSSSGRVHRYALHAGTGKRYVGVVTLGVANKVDAII